MILKRNKRISMILSILLVLSMATGVFANPLGHESFDEPIKDKLVGFEGENQLQGNDSLVEVIVELRQQPDKLEKAIAKNNNELLSGANFSNNAKMAREEFLGSLDNLMGGSYSSHKTYEIKATYTSAINGFAITLPDLVVEELTKLDSVYRIHLNEEIKLDLERPSDYQLLAGSSADSSSDSSKQLGMEDSRSYYKLDGLIEKGITGKGVTVGVIDSGVDYNHPDLKDAFVSTLPNGDSPTGEDLIDGIFYGRNYIDNGNGENNPMDDHGHGTHVSGTVAARGVNSPVSALGMAPEANLVGYKVITANDSVFPDALLSAMEDATNDGCDIINMSLGWSGENGPIHITTTAVNNLALSYPEVLFVIAGGNSGPNVSSIGSPGTSPLALTVANAQIPDKDKKFTVEVDGVIENDGGAINLIRSEWFNEVQEKDGLYELSGSILKANEDGKYKMLLLPNMENDGIGIGLGEEFTSYAEANPDKEDWENTIVVIRRGQNFDDTVRRLKDIGGGAIILLNNEGQDYTNISFYQGIFNDYLPLFTVSYEEGMKLIKNMDPGQEYSIGFSNVEDLGQVGINQSSSKGPITSTYDIGLDIAAIGTNVLSTVPLGFSSGTYEYSFAAMSGTSMASPHMAGFAALVKQDNSDFDALKVKAHLANTANPNIMNADVNTQGSGMVEPHLALGNKDFYVTATNDNGFIRNSNDELLRHEVETTTLSFGRVTLGQEANINVPISLHNDGVSETSFNVSIETNSLNGVSIQAGQDKLVVGPNSSIKTNIEANVSAEADQGVYEGYVVLTEDKEDNPLVLRMPLSIHVLESDEGKPAYDEEITFLQISALSNGENSQLKGEGPYNSSESLLHYTFVRDFDYFELLIADEDGELIGSASNWRHAETGVGGAWYYRGVAHGMYFPFVEVDGETVISNEIVKLPEGRYKFVLSPHSNFTGETVYHELDYVIDNTLPELTLNNSQGDKWFYETDGDEIVLKGKVFDKGTDEMEKAGINSFVNHKLFGKETSQMDNIVVLELNKEYHRATIDKEGNFQIRLPKSNDISQGKLYYGDHFLPAGIEGRWNRNVAVAGFAPDKLSYSVYPQYSRNVVPWMDGFAYRAANMDEINIQLLDGRYSINIKESSITRQENEVKIGLKLENLTSDSQNATVIVQAYDENGRVYRPVYESLSIGDLEEVDFNLMANDYPKGISYVKVFIWDNLSNMKPLVKVYTLR